MNSIRFRAACANCDRPFTGGSAHTAPIALPADCDPAIVCGTCAFAITVDKTAAMALIRRLRQSTRTGVNRHHQQQGNQRSRAWRQAEQVFATTGVA